MKTNPYVVVTSPDPELSIIEAICPCPEPCITYAAKKMKSTNRFLLLDYEETGYASGTDKLMALSLT